MIILYVHGGRIMPHVQPAVYANLFGHVAAQRGFKKGARTACPRADRLKSLKNTRTSCPRSFRLFVQSTRVSEWCCGNKSLTLEFLCNISRKAGP